MSQKKGLLPSVRYLVTERRKVTEVEILLTGLPRVRNVCSQQTSAVTIGCGWALKQAHGKLFRESRVINCPPPQKTHKRARDGSGRQIPGRFDRPPVIKGFYRSHWLAGF